MRDCVNKGEREISKKKNVRRQTGRNRAVDRLQRTDRKSRESDS